MRIDQSVNWKSDGGVCGLNPGVGSSSPPLSPQVKPSHLIFGNALVERHCQSY